MALEPREKTIAGESYRVSPLGAKRGRGMLVRLVKILGPGMGSFVGGVGRSPSGTVESALALGVGEAVHDLTARLREDELSAILDEFALTTILVKSAEIELRLSDVFDDHFAARYDVMLLWLRFCLEVNFGSFFDGSSGGASLGRFWKILSQLASRPASTGTSTESPAASATPTA